jgi:Vitamin K-dependent gamma-carboxylase
MSIRLLIAAWNNAFFTPRSPLPICLFRILHGACVVATLLLLRPDWEAWYGNQAWLTSASMGKIEPGVRLNLFRLIPAEDSWINGLFWLALVSAAFLTIGLFTRISSVASFICLASLHQRNLLILHGGDTFLRVAGFFLIFAPAGAVLSVDRLIRPGRGTHPGHSPELWSPWAQRMIQFELAMVYLFSFWWKSLGSPWIDGSALIYVSQVAELRRFPIPGWLLAPVVLKCGAWITLALEFALGALLWVKEFRYPLLILGCCFHLLLEYALNIPMFQWDILSAYVLFIDPADLERVWARLQGIRHNVTHACTSSPRLGSRRQSGSPAKRSPTADPTGRSA